MQGVYSFWKHLRHYKVHICKAIEPLAGQRFPRFKCDSYSCLALSLSLLQLLNTNLEHYGNLFRMHFNQ